MLKSNVVSIDKKKQDAKEKYLEISGIYYDMRQKYITAMQKLNEIQVKYSAQKEVVEIQTTLQMLQIEIDTFPKKLADLELEGAGIELPKTETKQTKKEKK